MSPRFLARKQNTRCVCVIWNQCNGMRDRFCLRRSAAAASFSECKQVELVVSRVRVHVTVSAYALM